MSLPEIKKYFNKSRKELLDNPLEEFGFKPYKTSFIARMTEDSVFQVISVQKYRHGGQFSVNISIRPMYSHREDYLTALPGNGLYAIVTKGRKDKWWPNTTEIEIDSSFKEIYRLIIKYAMPFFDSTTNSKDIIQSYKRNFFGCSKFGKSILWGTVGWENYDLGHIYLKAGDKKEALKEFSKCYKEFKSDNREWAQRVAAECLQIEQIIKKEQKEIDDYLEMTILESKRNLGLEKW